MGVDRVIDQAPIADKTTRVICAHKQTDTSAHTRARSSVGCRYMYGSRTAKPNTRYRRERLVYDAVAIHRQIFLHSLLRAGLLAQTVTDRACSRITRTTAKFRGRQQLLSAIARKLAADSIGRISRWKIGLGVCRKCSEIRQVEILRTESSGGR